MKTSVIKKYISGNDKPVISQYSTQSGRKINNPYEENQREWTIDVTEVLKSEDIIPKLPFKKEITIYHNKAEEIPVKIDNEIKPYIVIRDEKVYELHISTTDKNFVEGLKHGSIPLSDNIKVEIKVNPWENVFHDKEFIYRKKSFNNIKIKTNNNDEIYEFYNNEEMVYKLIETKTTKSNQYSDKKRIFYNYADKKILVMYEGETSRNTLYEMTEENKDKEYNFENEIVTKCILGKTHEIKRPINDNMTLIYTESEKKGYKDLKIAVKKGQETWRFTPGYYISNYKQIEKLSNYIDEIVKNNKSLFEVKKINDFNESIKIERKTKSFVETSSYRTNGKLIQYSRKKTSNNETYIIDAEIERFKIHLNIIDISNCMSKEYKIPTNNEDSEVIRTQSIKTCLYRDKNVKIHEMVSKVNKGSKIITLFNPLGLNYSLTLEKVVYDDVIDFYESEKQKEKINKINYIANITIYDPVLKQDKKILSYKIDATAFKKLKSSHLKDQSIFSTIANGHNRWVKKELEKKGKSNIRPRNVYIKINEQENIKNNKID